MIEGTIEVEIPLKVSVEAPIRVKIHGSVPSEEMPEIMATVRKHVRRLVWSAFLDYLRSRPKA